MKAGLQFGIVLVALASVAIALSSFIPKTSGSHISSTGAPGEQTCKQAGCHIDASIVSDSVTNTFLFGNNESVYTPGQTYQIKITTRRSGVSKFGFQAVALSEITETNAGLMAITDPVRTQLQDYASPPIQDRLYVTHTANGTIANTADSIQWSFDWTAPNTDIGPIVFYFATNCTNQNNQNTGDELHLSEFRITGPASGVEERQKELKVYYDASRQILHIKNFLAGSTCAKLMTIEGQKIGDFYLSGNSDYALVQALPNGIYFLRLEGGSATYLKRFMVF